MQDDRLYMTLDDRLDLLDDRLTAIQCKLNDMEAAVNDFVKVASESLAPLVESGPFKVLFGRKAK